MAITEGGFAIRHSINAVAFGPRATVSAVLEAFGPGEDFALVLPTWTLDNEPGGRDAAIARLRSGGRPIASMLQASWFTLDQPERWAAEQDSLIQAVRAAAAVDAPLLYGTTGPAGWLDFDGMAAALERALAPVRAVAEDCGVALLLESINPLRRSLSAVFSFRDLADLCAATGTRLCVDLTAVALDRDIAADLARHARDIPVVQVGDLMPDTLAVGQRAVPGDGDLPLGELITALVSGGFDGVLDLEAFGPRIDAEGAGPAMARGHRAMLDLLDQVVGQTAASS